MNGFWAAYAAAFWLGAAHALEVDHMVAVSTFVGGRPRFGAAVSFGVRWGVGHALVVLLAGGALAWTGIRFPGSARDWAELAVGVMLVALGIWALRASGRLHLHDPQRHGGHAHLHAHPPEQHPHTHTHLDPAKRHRHLSTLVGAVHGLAGTSPVVALIPVALMPDFWAATGYLAAFGVGTVLAMGLYAALAALLLSRAASSISTARLVAAVTGLGSMSIGVWWIVGAARTLVA